MTDTADPDTPCDSEDLKFINAAIKWFEENGQIMTDVTFNLKMKFCKKVKSRRLKTNYFSTLDTPAM